MPQIEIYPAGCGTAELSISGEMTNLPFGTGWWRGYRLVATPDVGFSFDHFSVDFRYTTPNGTTENNFRYHENPAGGDTQPEAWQLGPIHEFDVYYNDGRRYKIEIIGIRAVFSDERPILTTNSQPTFAGTTTGDGQYYPGTNAKITANAKCSLWKFNHWEVTLQDGVKLVSNEPEYEVQIPFGHGHIYCDAYFNHENTGEIICDSTSGAIICGSGGFPLYNGNNMTWD